MRNFKINPILSFIGIVMIVLLFTYTAISKLIEYDKFVFQMALSPFRPVSTFAPVLGWLMPTLEIMIALALLSERWRKIGLKATFVLLLVFEIYIGAMLLTGVQLPCTCGGVLSIMGWQTHLIFNAFFMLLAFIGLGYRSTKKAGINHFNKRIFNA
jgi:putative oxidoreductase